MIKIANEILVEILPEETRVALLENRELVEIYIEKICQRRMLGNIYRGRVTDIVPGIQAAFVDIGYSKNAFLHINDINNCDYPINENEIGCRINGEEKLRDIPKEEGIEDILTQGQEITVQVIKEPLGNKGPRITANITLPGRNLVLTPNMNSVGVSRKIENESERNRLKQITEKIKPENMGIIVRTVAREKEEKDFIEEIKFLTKTWETIKKEEERGCVPRCIHMEHNLLYRTIRDVFTQNIHKLIINDEDQYSNTLEYIEIISPSLKGRVELFDRSKSLFDYYNIESRLQKALSRKVWLKCGGYLVIDPTEALTVIDVNTGKFLGSTNQEDTVLKTNLEAVEEIAKQLRIRNIGGIIIIDLIDMAEHTHKNQVVERLKFELRKDRTKTSVIGMTGLGLIEMTRKKANPDLSSIL